MGDIHDKVVLITGAGKGTGRVLAETLAADGAIIAANDISPVNLDETVKRIQQAGGRVKAYVEDIAKRMPVQGLIRSVVDDWGRLDILINLAEVEPVFPVLDMDDWDWQRSLDVNLSGPFLLTQAAGRVMRDRGSGCIILVAERAKGKENRAAYFSSKAGLTTFVRQAVPELAVHHVQLVIVHPRVGEDIAAKIRLFF